MLKKYQTRESQELMFRLTHELVERDFDRIIGERLQEKIENEKAQKKNPQITPIDADYF
jgi:hypothetical protein